MYLVRSLGGGYVLPAPPFSIGFWKHVTDNLNKNDEDTSMVILEYGEYIKSNDRRPSLYLLDAYKDYSPK